MIKHGYNKRDDRHPLYTVWDGMKQRCGNPNTVHYNRYGGRGITVCDLWKESPAAFIEWAISKGWRKGLQIDRRDNDLGYYPENCRIVTARENVLNQTGLSAANTSGYKGVSLNKQTGRWEVSIVVNGKRVWLKRHSLIKDAVTAKNNYITENGLAEEYEIQKVRGVK